MSRRCLDRVDVASRLTYYISTPWTAGVFPVHSYRIQRRDINLFGHHNQELISDSHRIDESFSASSRSDWRTVYVGGDDEFVDSGLQLGHNYMYRIQAWNSVGRSSWEVLDISHDLKRQRCSTRPSFLHNAAKPDRSIPPSTISINEGIEWLSIPRKLVWGLVVIVQVRNLLDLRALGVDNDQQERFSGHVQCPAVFLCLHCSDGWDN